MRVYNILLGSGFSGHSKTICVCDQELRISCALPICGRHEIALSSGFDVRSGRARPEATAGK